MVEDLDIEKFAALYKARGETAIFMARVRITWSRNRNAIRALPQAVFPIPLPKPDLR